MSDPYAEFGGQAVQATADDPYAEFGGKAVSAPTTPTPTGTISNAPTGPLAWLRNLEGDVRYGTGTTLPGRLLQKAGARGVGDSGAAETVASPILGPIKTAQGVAETKSQPLQGAKDIAGGLLQTATLPASFVAPEASDAMTSLAQKVPRILPSAEHAGQVFNEVGEVANKVPVNLNSAAEGASRLLDWQRKAQLGPTINKFLNRITSPSQGPLTYEEARDFYKLLGNLSADEASKLPPAVKFDLTRTVVGLKQDVGAAAESVGKGRQYFDAMKEFAKAKRMEDLSDATKQIIMESLRRGLPYGIGTGLGLYGVKKFYDAAH